MNRNRIDKREGISILFIARYASSREAASSFPSNFYIWVLITICADALSCFRCLNWLILNMSMGHASFSTLSIFSHFCSQQILGNISLHLKKLMLSGLEEEIFSCHFTKFRVQLKIRKFWENQLFDFPV